MLTKPSLIRFVSPMRCTNCRIYPNEFSTTNIAIHCNSPLGKLGKIEQASAQTHCSGISLYSSGNLTDELNSFRDCSSVARIRHCHDCAAFYLKALTMSLVAIFVARSTTWNRPPTWTVHTVYPKMQWICSMSAVRGQQLEPVSDSPDSPPFCDYSFALPARKADPS